MDISSYIRTAVFKLLVLSVGGLALPGCDSVIYDGEGDCSVNYRVKFRYDMNLKFADAFASEVESVTLYLLDSDGRVAWQRTERGEALTKENYAMTVEQSATAGTALPDFSGTVTSVNAVVAELTTARLTVRDKTAATAAAAVAAAEKLPEERKMRLTVLDNDTGKTVVSLPLVDYALLVKGEYRRNMDDQEFLDRMDEYNLVFVLDQNHHWVSMSINIHSWKLVWQNTNI